MSLVKLEPARMSHGGIRVETEVAHSLVDVASGLGRGMPIGIDPHVRVRIAQIQARAAGEAFTRVAPMGAQLIQRGGLVLNADSSDLTAANSWMAAMARSSISLANRGISFARNVSNSSGWMRHLIGSKPGPGGHTARIPWLARLLDTRHRTAIENFFKTAGGAAKVKAVTGFLAKAATVVMVAQASVEVAFSGRDIYRLFSGQDRGEASARIESMMYGGDLIPQLMAVPATALNDLGVGALGLDTGQREHHLQEMREGKMGVVGHAWAGVSDVVGGVTTDVVRDVSGGAAGIGDMLGLDTSGLKETSAAANSEHARYNHSIEQNVVQTVRDTKNFGESVAKGAGKAIDSILPW